MRISDWSSDVCSSDLNRLDTKDDCLSFLNALVRYAEDDLIADLGKYSRAALLESLLRNHERAIAERDHWKRTTAALIGLHGATEDTYGLIRDHRSEERRVGKECVSTCRSRWAPYH